MSELEETKCDGRSLEAGGLELTSRRHYRRLPDISTMAANTKSQSSRSFDSGICVLLSGDNDDDDDGDGDGDSNDDNDDDDDDDDNDDDDHDKNDDDADDNGHDADGDNDDGDNNDDNDDDDDNNDALRLGLALAPAGRGE